MRFIYIALASLMIFAGCETTNISKVPYKKESSKYVNNLAILYSDEIPEMYVNVRNDDRLITALFAGPAIVSQIIMQTAFYFARQGDQRMLSDLVFDLNIGEVLCKKLNTKFQLCSYFHVVPQETIERNKAVWKLLDKKEKELNDYQSIGVELGVDALLEVKILSYGIKDPGIFSDPYAILKAEVKMTTVSEGVVIWRDIIYVKKGVEMDTIDFIDAVLTDAKVLKEELENAADVASEECLERLGFDTSYTYLLDKDYIERTEHKIDIARKLDEINTLRYENLITNIDYDEKKLDLIERTKMMKIVQHKDMLISTENDENMQVLIVKEKNKLPSLPRRD